MRVAVRAADLVPVPIPPSMPDIWAEEGTRRSVAALEPIQRIALHNQVFRRFFLVIWHAMPLILLSGFTVLLVFDGGPAVAGWNVNLMMLLGLIMTAVLLLIVFQPLCAVPPHH